MPYIKQHTRDLIDFDIEALTHTLNNAGAVAGDLNYVITRLLLGTLLAGETRYAKINEAVGVLECAKLELYRVLVGPYEDNKAIENGGVYPTNDPNSPQYTQEPPKYL